MSTHLDSLHWRYATKKFDPTKKLTDAQLQELLDAVQLSASSYGLQAYKIVVVTNPAIREKIKEHAWNQTQVTDASHLIAICTYKSIDEAYVDSFISLIAETRGLTAESLAGYREMMVGSIKGRTTEELAHWLRCQGYIALGFLLSAAAEAHIDSCPMEGFDAAHVDVDLDLLESNLTTVALCPVGFRADDDATASYAKVRFPKEELVLWKN